MSYSKYKKIFSEGKIGNITIPNRLVMAPMGVGHHGEFFEDRLIEFYGARAKGGIGLIFTENCYVSSVKDDPYPRFMPVPRFDDRRKLSRAHAIARRVKMYGGVPGIQLGAGQGRNADFVDPSNPPASASPCPTMADPSVICREMTVDEIKAKVEAFGRVAAIAKIAEFQVIEVHAHTGYLLEQFLSRQLNHRNDQYGGSPENRFRFAKEILEAIRASVGHDLAVSIRLSVDHKSEDSITLEEGLEYCRLAEQAGYDAVHIDAGCHKAIHWTVPAPYTGKTPLAYLAKEVKKVVNIPVITVGGYLMPEYAEEVLEEGGADFVALGRELLADPDWAKKARLGKEDQIRGCLQCNEMCSGFNSMARTATCSVNPTCGREFEFHYMPKVAEPKRVTIVGAGPAGLVTAIEATNLGHEVTVLEKSGELGGHVNLVAKEECKQGIRNYLNYLKRQVELKNIKVEFNCEADVEKVRATNPDVVVAATGANLFIPPLPGFDSDKVVTVEGMYETDLSDKENIIVVGGGVTGCELAYTLANEGHKVSIIEMMDQFAVGLSAINRCSLLDQMNRAENLTQLPSTKCKCIEGDRMICVDKDGKELEIPFDLVISAVGLKSERTLAMQLDEEFPEVYMIGDAAEVAKIGDAVHQGFFTALKI